MTDELFRWVVAAGVGLACLAMVVQAIVLLMFYRSIRRLQEQAAPLIDRVDPVLRKAEPMMDRVSAVLEKAGPVLEKAGPVLEKAGTAIGPLFESIGSVADKAGHLVVSVNHLVDDARPRVAEISDETLAIVKTSRDQVERVGELLQDAAGRTRERFHELGDGPGRLSIAGGVLAVITLSFEEFAATSVNCPAGSVRAKAAVCSACTSVLKLASAVCCVVSADCWSCITVNSAS